MKARSDMFGSRIDPQDVPADLQDFESYYLHPNGRMLAALDDTGRLLGAIAYRKYDRRFPHLQFEENKNIVEIVRLYVLPDARRSGLATQLFRTLQCEASERSCEILYLHTHPFLDGAIEFWKAHGFKIICRDADAVWQTVHMIR